MAASARLVCVCRGGLTALNVAGWPPKAVMMIMMMARTMAQSVTQELRRQLRLWRATTGRAPGTFTAGIEWAVAVLQ